MEKLKSKDRTLAIDIGGSGIKAMVLDRKGRPLGDRVRVQTPQPATPEAVLRAIADLAKQAGACDRVSVGFPGVVRHGIVYTAVNLHPNWVEFDLASPLSESLGKPVRVANDADIQGFGAISGQGVELAIALGTGLGTALFVDGKLVPNLECGHHPFRKKQTYEQQLGRAALEKVGTKKWNKRLKKAICKLQHLFNADRIYLGGGEAKKVDFELPENVSIVPNINGLLGGIALWNL
ncbi:MAG: ROK family protein [Roseofilum sp. SBFL]|uniref:ROK family protein n=1 Tax=unclassified Roseofilum TaxID=2620099 RepID=UPI001B1946EA|nr:MULTISPECIES: ROK family protein [unclassified Roseofilum]MBP0015785.1 ROK family protein [Roseofilum sp. SID3]MBP0023050.1 ROK family protein [Roseofilum sp. SID2]MBP0039076.1 ROK family protein [Roseofilum sp. SID1]MBP0041233.1 ROK family protein [Roseofilum sp. SBFL]